LDFAAFQISKFQSRDAKKISKNLKYNYFDLDKAEMTVVKRME
jgi:hypothetical protein